jgi:hypothetical protein
MIDSRDGRRTDRSSRWKDRFGKGQMEGRDRRIDSSGIKKEGQTEDQGGRIE